MKVRKTLELCLVAGLLFAALFQGQAQGFLSNKPIEISIFDNATLLPGADQWGIVGLPFHPGVSVGTEFRYNENEKNHLFQTVRLAYTFHRYVQQTLQLYSEFGYRRQLGLRWDLEGRIGGGYLHAFPHGGIFSQNSNGQYEKVSNWGRPQAMLSLAGGPGYRVAGTPEKPVRIFLHYQVYMQMPFVPGYVPLLPNTALHVGLYFSI